MTLEIISNMRQLLLVIGLILAVSGRAEDIRIRDVFRSMPDSLMPYLSQNNRLDFIDFIDSNMKAEVKNILGGTSEMTSLADDSLSIRMSPALKIDMFLLHSQAVTGDSSLVVCMVQTFGIDSLSLESTVDYYTLSWQHMITPPQLSPSDKQRIERVKVQTIFNWRRKILKNN